MAAKERNASAFGETPELIQFANEFRDEAHLRNVLKELFERMKFSRVLITHGANERGKDIVFFGKGQLGETELTQLPQFEG